MKIAMSSRETLYFHAVEGIAAHVTELAPALERCGHEVHVSTRPGYGNGGVRRIDGGWYLYCPQNLSRNSADEIREMCRSFVGHFLQTEDLIGHLDVVRSAPKRIATAVGSGYGREICRRFEGMLTHDFQETAVPGRASRV